MANTGLIKDACIIDACTRMILDGQGRMLNHPYEDETHLLGHRYPGDDVDTRVLNESTIQYIQEWC